MRMRGSDNKNREMRSTAAVKTGEGHDATSRGKTHDDVKLGIDIDDFAVLVHDRQSRDPAFVKCVQGVNQWRVHGRGRNVFVRAEW